MRNEPLLQKWRLKTRMLALLACGGWFKLLNDLHLNHWEGIPQHYWTVEEGWLRGGNWYISLAEGLRAVSGGWARGRLTPWRTGALLGPPPVISGHSTNQPCESAWAQPNRRDWRGRHGRWFSKNPFLINMRLSRYRMLVRRMAEERVISDTIMICVDQIAVDTDDYERTLWSAT